MSNRPQRVGQWVSVNKPAHISQSVSWSVGGATLLSISSAAGASAPSLRLIILSWTSSFHARPASAAAYLSIYLHRRRLRGCFAARAPAVKIMWLSKFASVFAIFSIKMLGFCVLMQMLTLLLTSEALFQPQMHQTKCRLAVGGKGGKADTATENTDTLQC